MIYAKKCSLLRGIFFELRDMLFVRLSCLNIYSRSVATQQMFIKKIGFVGFLSSQLKYSRNLQDILMMYSQLIPKAY